jgi:hypothetical protein
MSTPTLSIWFSHSSKSPSPTYHQIQPSPIKRRRHYSPNNNNYNVHNINIKNDKNYNENYKNELFNGLILSDSMISRVRTYAIKILNLINVKLSYESVCDCIKMLQWLPSPQGHHTVKNSSFLVFSLGTNDVGRRYLQDRSQRNSFQWRKYEEALRNWFCTHAVTHSSVSFQCNRLPSTLNNNNDISNNGNPMYMCHRYRQSYHQKYSNR